MERQYSVFSPVVQAVILGLFVGCVAGYFIRIWHEGTLKWPSNSPQQPSQGQGPGGGMGGMMGGMGGMMGGRGGGQPASQPSGTTLASLVRNIDTVESVQGAALSPAQQQQLAPVLKGMKSASKISDTDAKADTDKINAILNQSQKDALTKLTPARGGRGGPGGGMGGGMMGGMMGGMGGRMGGGYPGGGMMGGGRPGGGPGAGGPRPGGMPGGPGGMGGGPRPGGMPGGMGGMGGGMGGMGGGMGGMMGGMGADPEKPFASDRNSQALDDLIKRVHA